MGKHKTYITGEKIPHNDFMDYKEYALYADLVAAVAGYGAAEVGRNFLCIETGRYYYWNGGALMAYPSTGGAGAPPDASYITINAEPTLSGETRHELLTNVTGHLHEPLYHKISHQLLGSDPINVFGLSGRLADDQIAGWIHTVRINPPVAGDDLKFLQYDHSGGKYKHTAVSGGGDMLKADYALDAVRVKLAVDSDTLDTKHAADFATAEHHATHVVGGSSAFAATAPFDSINAIARVTVRKNYGVFPVGAEPKINFVEGSGISLNVSNPAGEIVVQIAAGPGGLGGTWSRGTCSGRSPIVTPHSLGGTPTLVLPSIRAAQAYPSPCWTADNTNITFRHAVTAGCTICFIASL